MRLKILSVVFLWTYFCHVVEGATILAVFSSLSFTDHLVFRGYISLLVRRGHSVVLMTPYPGYFPHPEAEHISELDVGQASAPFWDEYKKLITNTEDYYSRLKAINEFSVKLAIAQLKSKQMQALLVNPNMRFDLVITEADMPLLYAVAEKYQAPHISITTSTGKIHQHEAKGNPVHPILYPDVNALEYGNLSRWDKIMEFYRHVQTKNEYYNNYQPLCELAATKLLGLKRPLQEVEEDIDLLIIANNPVLIGNRPSVPAVIYADRMHIKPGIKLPQDLLSILDASEKGVVYFSLGAIQEAEQLSIHILQTLADSFRELPFTVLWKIGNTTMFNKPDNVIAQDWFPQQQILAHPNVKAFITHGGSCSLQEAIFYEVPIIGFPNVKSRKVFIRQVTKHGAGEILDPSYMDKENVKSVITTVATKDEYKLAITKLRQKLFDPLVSGPDEAIWWTEYLLRHGTARHLRSSAVGITSIRYFMIDVLCYFLIGDRKSVV